MLQNGRSGAYAAGMEQGTAAQVMVLGGDKATDTSDASQANAHAATAADNSLL